MARSTPTSRRLIVGIDLGGTNMQIGVTTQEGRILGRAKKKTRAEEGSAKVIARIVEGIDEACADGGVKPTDISCVGIGAPGAIDPKTGVVLEAPNLRWNKVPLAKILSQKMKRPVYVDNDVRSAIFGEHRLGAGRGCSELMGVWIGTGIGGGLILRNELYHGHTNTAGEVGHAILFPHMPPGSRTLENTASRTAIVDRILRLIRSNHKSIIPKLTGGDLSEIKARVVAEAYAKGDKLTRLVVDDAMHNLGVSIGSVVTILGLQRIVLGGGLTEAMGDDLVSVARAGIRAHAFPAVAKHVEVVATELEADAGLLGAAMLAREHLRSRA